MKENKKSGWGILKGPVCIDTGLFIEFFSESDLGNEVSNKIFNNPEITEIFIHDLLISEVYYIFCRQHGKNYADKIINDLVAMTSVISSENLRILAGGLKCSRTLSLADCYSCAIAIFFDCPVIFKKEEELTKEIQKDPFKFDLRIVEEN